MFHVKFCCLRASGVEFSFECKLLKKDSKLKVALELFWSGSKSLITTLRLGFVHLITAF